MARITVEDCTRVVSNRFELVLLAAEQARRISRNGTPAGLAQGPGGKPVTALRQIANGMAAPDELRDSVISKFQKTVNFDDDLPEVIAVAPELTEDQLVELLQAETRLGRARHHANGAGSLSEAELAFYDL